MSGAKADIARRAYEAFNRGGVEAILEFLDPDIEWRMWERFARDERVYHGHDGVREVIAIFEENLDGFRVDPHEFIEVGERVLVPVRMRGCPKGTDVEQSFELVQVWETRDGSHASRLEVYETVDEAMAAIDASASPGPG